VNEKGVYLQKDCVSIFKGIVLFILPYAAAAQSVILTYEHDKHMYIHTGLEKA